MELTSDDLSLIRAALMRNFTVAQLEATGLIDEPLDSKLIRLALSEVDFEFFMKFYLGHHFYLPFGSMHHEIVLEIEDVMSTKGKIYSAVIWPRGFGKTTTITLALPLWCSLLKKRRFILIISDSHDQAKQQLANLQSEIENNERIREDFGDMKGRVWQRSEIELANMVRIEALGSGMKVRGRKYLWFRPDLIVLDDTENLKSVQSKTQRETNYSWLTQSVIRAGWSDTKIFAVGNFLHFDCMLKRIVANPMFRHRVYQAVVSWAKNQRLWDDWRVLLTNLSDEHKNETARTFFEKHRDAMLEGAKSAWPEGYSYYDLMVTKVSEGNVSFYTELMNDPRDPSRCIFNRWYTYRKEYRQNEEGIPELWLIPNKEGASTRLVDCKIFAFTDPSLGKTSSADYSAIIIVAKAPDRRMYVLEADLKRRPPTQIMMDQNAFARDYIFSRWGIESTQFQAFFASESARVSMESGTNIPFMQVNQHANKELRIQSLQPDLENGYLLLLEGGQDLLKQQLTEFPVGTYDDGPDALEGCRTIAQNWAPIKSSEIMQSEPHDFGQRTYSRSRVPMNDPDPYAEHDARAREEINRQRILNDQEPLPEPAFMPQMFC